MIETLLGNRVAEKCLLFIANYREGYINGIARTFNISPSQVKKQLERLETGGVLVSRRAGNVKMFMFNPRAVYKRELQILLEKVLMNLPKPELQEYYRKRRRPRRTGKRIEKD
ncbi:MAG: winged helix-turn-helix domain-containing protein [Bdellovibrionales bacterium]|nr:winged helix-turn-helix domain-containing protein [Bdellovibrionales bacterium]